MWISCQPLLSSPQLHQSQLELQEVRLSYRQLQVKVEELTEERSLQGSAATSTSLLSEIEQSMEAEELEQEREQVLPRRVQRASSSSTLDCTCKGLWPQAAAVARPLCIATKA